jgi:uncharacterized protein YqgQ
MAFSLKQLVFDQIKRRRLRNLVDKKTLWPSQASVLSTSGDVIGRCLRASFYEKTGVKETNPVSDRVTLMGYMGTMIEDGLIDLTKNAGIWEANNVKFEFEGVSGEIDIAIRPLNLELNPPEEEQYIVECKSCSGYYINKEVFGYNEGRGENKTYVKGKPKDPHLLQAAIYAHVGRQKGFKGTIILYVSRDEAALAEFLITVDEDGKVFINGELDPRFKMKDIFYRYDLLRRYITSNELPDRDYKPEYTDAEVKALFESKQISKTVYEAHNNRKELYCDEQCDYCPFKLKCLNQTSTTVTEVIEDPFNLVKTQIEEKPDFFKFGSL